MFFYRESPIPVPPSIVTNGLIMNLDAGNTASYPGSGDNWLDLSGNGNNGSLNGGVVFNPASSGFLVFDGVDNYVTTPVQIEAPTNSNLQTFSAWLVNASGSVFGSSAASNGMSHLRITLDSVGNLIFFETAYGGASGEGIDSVAVTPKIANNIVLVKTAAQKYDVYLNAEKVLNQVTKKATVNSLFYGGVYYFSSGVGNYHDGKVSNYMIYNRSLTQQEITQNYQAIKNRYGL
jgi:hypothetical protein